MIKKNSRRAGGVSPQFTAGQSARIARTARQFKCTSDDLIVALTMGNLAMHRRTGGFRRNKENALNVKEWLAAFTSHASGKAVAS